MFKRRRITPVGVDSGIDTVSSGTSPLVAPVAIRCIDLAHPLRDIQVPREGSQKPYRSLWVTACRGDVPVAVATFDLQGRARVSREELAQALARELSRGGRGAVMTCATESRGSIGTEPGPAARERRRPTGAVSPSVSVVVATRHFSSVLERCVRSILACDYDDFEVIVVDNGRGYADTSARLSERFPGDLRLRSVDEPRRGASRARNAGLRAARGDVVAFSDDDVVVAQGWIRAGVEALDRRDNVACVSGLILPLELEVDSQIRLEQFATFGKGFERRTYCVPDSRADIPFFPYAPGAVGSGANMVMRAEVARELGGFDIALGPGTPTTGGEDLDLYVRVLLAGYAVSYEPGAVVWHQHPRGERRLRRQAYSYGVGLGALLGKQLSGRATATPTGLQLRRRAGGAAGKATVRRERSRRLHSGDTRGCPIRPRPQLAEEYR